MSLAIRFPPARLGLPLSLALGLVFFVLRVTRYDLFVALGGSDFARLIKFLVEPGLLVGHPLRDALLTTMNFGQRAFVTLAVHAGLDPFQVEHVRLLALNLLAAAAIWSLAWALFQDLVTGLLSVLLVVGGGMGALGLGFLWKLGEFAEWHYFGLVLGLFVLNALYRRAYGWASFLVGLLLWIHPSHALIAGLLGVTVYVALERPLRPQDAARYGALLILAAAPAVVYLAPKFTALAGTGSDPSTWWTFMRARKPHHLFPFAWSWRLWVGNGLYVLACLIARHVVRRPTVGEPRVARLERTTLVLLLAAAAICLAGVIFSEIIPVVLATKLTLFRASNYLAILLALYLCALVRTWLAARVPLAWAAGLVLASAMIWLDVWHKLAVPVIFLMGLVALLRSWRAKDDAAGGEGWLAVGAAGLLVLTLVHVYLQALPPYARMGAYTQVEYARWWKDVQLWSRANTPQGAIFVTPPDWCGFEILSDRAFIIDLCTVGESVYAGRTAAEEIRRIRAYDARPGAGIPLSSAFFRGLEAHYEGLEAGELGRLAAAFGATYAIEPKPTDLPLPRAYENRGFVVYRVEQ